MSLLLSYLNNINEDKQQSPLYLLCKSEPQTTTHLFNCTNINTQLKVTDLWTTPVELGNLSVKWRGPPVKQRARMPARWGYHRPMCVETDNSVWGRQQQTGRMAVFCHHCWSTSTNTIYLSQPRINHSGGSPWVNSHITREQTVFKRIMTRQKLLHFIYGTKRPNVRRRSSGTTVTWRTMIILNT